MTDEFVCGLSYVFQECFLEGKVRREKREGRREEKRALKSEEKCQRKKGDKSRR